MYNIKFNFCPVAYEHQTAEKTYLYSIVPKDGYKYCNPRFISKNTPVSLIDIDSIEPNNYVCFEKDALPWIQMFNSGFRIGKENPNLWEYWNRCVYVDIDSKNYNSDWNDVIIENAKKFKDNIELVYETICNRLSTHWEYKQIFYFAQRSHSGNSFHFVFYFNDAEQNYTDFTKASQVATNIVKEMFCETLTFGVEMMNYPKVVDACAENPTQVMYISKNSLYINNECTGYYNLDSVVSKKKEIKYTPIDVVFDNSDVFFKNTYTATGDKFSWDHFDILSLSCVLVRVFGDDFERVEKLFDDFAPWLAEQVKRNKNNHSQSWLRSNLSTHYRQIYNYVCQNPNSYEPRKDMVEFCKEQFNINYELNTKFRPVKIESVNYNKVYTLNAGERLSSIIKEIIELPHRHIYLDAGCGVGKTYSAKHYINSVKEKIDLFNIENKRICFITPMTSINKNSFDNDSNWVVIDSNHKSNRDKLISNKSICTTWNSFCLFGMADMNFDIYMFDETHSMFLYDYRVKDINNLLKDLDKFRNKENQKKVIFLSGTPSKDIKLFEDFYKIKINKDVFNIPVNMNFYDDNYKGLLYSDIREWLKDKNHTALVMCDKANVYMEEQFNRRGLKVNRVYNKSYDNDVKYIDEHKSEEDPNLDGQLILVSTYGQAGVNMYAKKDQSVRIYILNNNAMSIIQYMNRLRNTKHIDCVNLFFRKDEIDNNINTYNVINETEAKRKVSLLNSMQDVDVMYYINFTFKMNKDVIDVDSNNKRVLNSELFRLYESINNNNDYESQLQVIWNRLVSAQCDVKFNYLTDVKDVYDKKFRGNFAGVVSGINFKKCLKETKNNSVEIMMNSDKTMKKYLVPEVKANLEFIVNYYYDEYIKNNKGTYNFENACDYICSNFNEFVYQTMNKTGRESTITKTDLKEYKTALQFIKHQGEYRDSLFFDHLRQCDIDDDWFFKYAAGYTAIVANTSMTNSDLYQIVEEAYTGLKSLHSIINNYTWLIDLDDTDTVYEPKYDQRIVELTYKYISKKHTRGKQNQKKISVYDSDGNLVCSFDSVNECAEYYNMNRDTITRLVKSGKLNKKLGVLFLSE